MRNHAQRRSVVAYFRSHSACRVAMVAVMLLSWFVITNHCALGLMGVAPAAQTAHACCHKNDAPAKEAPKAPFECCGAIKASLTDNAAAKIDGLKVAFELAVTIVLANVETLAGAPAFSCEHGPPPGLSFAELVLQRSLPSHAPPIHA